MTDDEIVAALEAIPAAEVAKRAVIVYRCPRGCVLLAVFRYDGRHFGYKPRVKLSDAVNQANSVAAARAKKTIDGDRRWRAYAFPLSRAGGLLSTDCNHVRAKVDVETVERDLAAATRQREAIPLSHNEVR
jgi:hypothetical protein